MASGRSPYSEGDLPGPLNVFCASKLPGEYNVQAACSARVSWSGRLGSTVPGHVAPRVGSTSRA